MNKQIEYTFNDGENTTVVDRNKELITMYERSGWSRSYFLTFKELLDNASHWNISINLNDCDEIIAKIATNIILANNAVSHNLDPFLYIQRTHRITDNRDLVIIKNFEALFDKYSHNQVIEVMSEKIQQSLLNILSKKN